MLESGEQALLLGHGAEGILHGGDFGLEFLLVGGGVNEAGEGQAESQCSDQAGEVFHEGKQGRVGRDVPEARTDCDEIPGGVAGPCSGTAGSTTPRHSPRPMRRAPARSA